MFIQPVGQEKLATKTNKIRLGVLFSSTGHTYVHKNLFMREYLRDDIRWLNTENMHTKKRKKNRFLIFFLCMVETLLHFHYKNNMKPCTEFHTEISQSRVKA